MLWQRKVRLGTRDLALEGALTRAEALDALAVGVEVAGRLVDQGADLLLHALEGARERRQRGGQLPVLRGGRLQIGDPIAEQVALGDRGAGAQERKIFLRPL